jgi:hypothetical protein
MVWKIIADVLIAWLLISLLASALLTWFYWGADEDKD